MNRGYNVIMRILLVEDNKKLSDFVKQMFEEAGFAVDAVYDGVSEERRAKNGSYDLIILDVLLPEKNGLEVCKELRAKNVLTPILMLTALSEIMNKVEGLDSGADDYLVKPFDLAELLARTRALLRRPTTQFINLIKINNLELNPATRLVKQNDVVLELTLKEFMVLEYLMRNAGLVVTREQLLEHCWDFAYSAFSNITDVYIKQLRKKLHDTDQQIIKTIRGVGYTFTE
jgi:DNA-binding response OmpR family regulator